MHVTFGKWKTWVATLVCAIVAGPAFALSITDPGVVGTVKAGTQPAEVTNVLTWSNYLLSLGAGAKAIYDADGNGIMESYERSSGNYKGVLSGGTRVDGGSANVTGYEWVMAKYNGPNGGYVLFHVPTYGNTIPGTSGSMFGNVSYGLSNFTGFRAASVPDGGATLGLLGLAMLGVGYFRKRFA